MAQTLDNDITKSHCPEDKVVCLIIDECHRTVGLHQIVKAIRALSDSPGGCRVIGLSATPGSCSDKIQEVLSNLRSERLEFRSEEDPDVKQYKFPRQVDVEVVGGDDTTDELAVCTKLCHEACHPPPPRSWSCSY